MCYFNASVENGADEKVKQYIKGYLDEMNDRRKEGSAFGFQKQQ